MNLIHLRRFEELYLVWSRGRLLALMDSMLVFPKELEFSGTSNYISLASGSEW